MKKLRALYMILVDILAMPIIATFMIIMVVVNVVRCVRNDYGMAEFMRQHMAIIEGIGLGLEQQIYWVNHGTNT